MSVTENKQIKGKMSALFYEDGSIDTEFEGEIPLTKLTASIYRMRRDYRLKYSVLKSVVHKQEMAQERKEKARQARREPPLDFGEVETEQIQEKEDD